MCCIFISCVFLVFFFAARARRARAARGEQERRGRGHRFPPSGRAGCWGEGARGGPEFWLPNGVKQRIRILEVTPDPEDPDGELVLHRITTVDALGHESELCQPDPQGDRWAFPLRGQWSNEGERTSEAGFTLTCSAGAQGKCVRFGYKPWKTRPDGVALAIFHAACIKAVRADYCGDHATTRDGQLIDIYDRLGIQRRDGASTVDLPFEAGFSPSGAVCVAHTRVPANVTLMP